MWKVLCHFVVLVAIYGEIRVLQYNFTASWSISSLKNFYINIVNFGNDVLVLIHSVCSLYFLSCVVFLYFILVLLCCSLRRLLFLSRSHYRHWCLLRIISIPRLAALKSHLFGFMVFNATNNTISVISWWAPLVIKAKS